MAKKRKFSKTKEWLIEEYVNKNRSRKDVAKDCDLSESGLKSLLVEWKIEKNKLKLDEKYIKEQFENDVPISKIGEYFGCKEKPINKIIEKLGLKRERIKTGFSRYNDKNDELMISLYLDGLSSTVIAKYFNVSHKTILNHLTKNKINRRTLSESQWNSQNKKFPKDLKDYDKIYNLYINQKISKIDLAKSYNCDPCVIDRVLKKFKIPIRNNSEAKIGLQVGENHPNWKGGITLLHLRLRQWFYNHQAKQVKDRDNNVCQICGKNHNLEVHHIISFKQLLDRFLKEHSNLDIKDNINELYALGTKYKPLNDLDNLITYCKDCHLFTIHKYNKNN